MFEHVLCFGTKRHVPFLKLTIVSVEIIAPTSLILYYFEIASIALGRSLIPGYQQVDSGESFWLFIVFHLIRRKCQNLYNEHRCLADWNMSLWADYRNFNLPCRAKLRVFDYFFISKAFREGGIDLCLGGLGKIEPKLSGFKWFFTRAPKSLTAINTCLDEME